MKIMLVFMISVFLSLLLTGSRVVAEETVAACMLKPSPTDSDNSWIFEPLLTTGDSIGGYTPPGIPDGIGAMQGSDPGTITIYFNHEMGEKEGYPYRLANGTRLRGARISRITVDRTTRKPVSAGLAYDRIIDRQGRPVMSAGQVNERDHASAGLSHLCSARLVEAGTRGFTDTVYMTGEETHEDDSHGHGGTVWVLDVAGHTLWAAPDLGRGAWENMTPVQAIDEEHVALLMGNDTPGASLYLYSGHKQPGGNFLQRNGLAGGQLYCWRADGDASTPVDFHGTGQALTGHFIPLKVNEPGHAGKHGHDDQGYLDGDTLQQQARQAGCFSFSRPEDLHDNPHDPSRAVFSSTGRADLYPEDTWGTLYTVDIDITRLSAKLHILYDGDDENHHDDGIRSPDNVVWADNGRIYVQEDNAIHTDQFGTNGMEASIWEVDPDNGTVKRIAVIDRNTVLPEDAHDKNADRIGAWESSGIIDVSRWFASRHGQTVLLADVQAHGINDGSIGGKKQLVESGQLVFLTSTEKAMEAEPSNKAPTSFQGE